MKTNNGIAGGLRQATELTRAGRLVEATAVIQRTLRKNSKPETEAADHKSDQGGATTGRVIDGVFSKVFDAPSPPMAEVPHPHATAVDAQPGTFITGSYANQAGTRPYKLYVPSSYVGQALPLVVMLHGCTQTPDDFAVGTRMNALAEERQCLVLYPAQTRAANRSRCWNWFKRTDQHRDAGEPAIIAGMTRDVVNRYRIDARKIYVAGLSAGGAMAAVMGTAYPDLYAAIGIHSGLASGAAHDLPSALAAMRGRHASASGGSAAPGSAPRVPIIVFHGDRDKTVHPRNGEHVISEGSGGDAVVEHGRVPGGHAYTRTVHRNPQGRMVLEHWLVHGAGHAWFGGSTRGSFTDPKGPDATREMMRFFAQGA